MGEGTDEVRREDRLAGDGQSRAADLDEAAQPAADPAEIRAEIEQTRSQMGETIDEIQSRLSPQHLGQQVKEQVREATIGRAEQMVRNAGESIDEARYGLMETIRHNPIPAAMVGLGLGWLFMNRRSAPPRRHRDYPRRYEGYPTYRGPEGYYPGEPGYGVPPTYRYQSEQGREEHGGGVTHAAGQVIGKAQETAGSVASQARDAAGNLVGQVRETAGGIAGQAQYQAWRVEDSFQQTMIENPLGVAAAALALGAAVGFSLPRTEQENRLMGEARESLVDKAQEVAQQTVDKVQRVAGEAVESAEQTVRERAREHGYTGEPV